MGLWSNLARYALMASPYVAAPFTGGATLAAIGAGSSAANALLGGGDAKDALLAGGLGAAGPALGAAAGASTAVPAVGAAGAVPGAVGAAPQAGGFWSSLANRAQEGLHQRDFWTTAAKSVAGGVAAHQANQPSIGDIQRLEYIRGGGIDGAYTHKSTPREIEEAKKRLNGPGFWQDLLSYGVAPGLALYGSTFPAYDPKGGR
jgi:hypothetical protein